MTSATTNYARDISHALSSNKHLLRWVEKMAELTKPDNIHWVDGSEEENEKLCAQIHAARTASDITVLDVGGTVTAFQSTLPRGQRRLAPGSPAACRCFNPRCPRGERRPDDVHYVHRATVSIHAAQ